MKEDWKTKIAQILKEYQRKTKKRSKHYKGCFFCFQVRLLENQLQNNENLDKIVKHLEDLNKILDQHQEISELLIRKERENKLKIKRLERILIITLLANISLLLLIVFKL